MLIGDSNNHLFYSLNDLKMKHSFRFSVSITSDSYVCCMKSIQVMGIHRLLVGVDAVSCAIDDLSYTFPFHFGGAIVISVKLVVVTKEW